MNRLHDINDSLGYLILQVESARRFNVDLTPYPNIVAIDRACGELDAFLRAAVIAA